MPVSLQGGHESVARAVPVSIRCRWSPDPAEVLRCQERTQGEDKFWRGEAIGTMSGLWPWSELKAEALTTATEFARNMKKQKQEYELVGNPEDMLLHGPYMEKVDFQKSQEVIPVYGVGGTVSYEYNRGFLYGKDEWDFSKGVAMFIVGTFLAKFGTLTTDGKQVIV